MLGSNKSLSWKECSPAVGEDGRARAGGGQRRGRRGWLARTTRQRRRRADLLSRHPAEPAASAACYVDALWAFTSWLIISQLLVMVAFQELPESLLDLSSRSLESAVQSVSGSKWVQRILITFSVKVPLVAQSDK